MIVCWIRASDDFDVEGVIVSLTDAEGHAIENGEAAEFVSDQAMVKGRAGRLNVGDRSEVTG